MRNSIWLVVSALIVLLHFDLARAGGFDQAELAGTDDLGRSLPTFAQTGPLKPGRSVGLFYWQWHVGLRALPHDYDMTEFLKTHPKFMDFVAFPPGGPVHPTYYWAQPIFGYYRSNDPWVIRKQLPLLAAAGVDFLFLDDTNDSIYDPEMKTFLAIAESMKKDGLAVPKLTFFLNHEPDWKIEGLYLKWYKPGKYDDMWFNYQGKPLLMAAMPTDAGKLKNPALLPEIQRFFTWRPTWAMGRADHDPHLWRFLSKPVNPPAVDDQGKVEQMVVNKSMGGPIWNALADGGVSETAISQASTQATATATATAATTAPSPAAHTAADYDGNWMLPDAAQGIFFKAEWEHALKVAPPILLVTGWNEWTASVWDTPGVVMLGRTTVKGQGHIVDEFNMQFNRDLEPMRGGYGDDYYWQFVENMRRYKGLPTPQKLSAEKTITSARALSQWDDVTPIFHGVVGMTTTRDWDSNVKGLHYTDNSARNEIASAQVARDARTVWFRVHTTGPLSPPTDRNWMTLLIDVDQDAGTGWHGYDLMVDRTRSGSQVSVEKNTGNGWSWTPVASAQAVYLQGSDLVIALPRELFRKGELSFDFKWIDNMGDTPDVMDFYTRGDTAPVGRFNFRFGQTP
jgi:hypothetical protein